MRAWSGWFGFGSATPDSADLPSKEPIDPRGFFPDARKPVSIHIQGFEGGFRFPEADEPIWGMVFQAISITTGEIMAANSPKEACRKFTVIAWDPVSRRLDVKLN